MIPAGLAASNRISGSNHLCFLSGGSAFTIDGHVLSEAVLWKRMPTKVGTGSRIVKGASNAGMMTDDGYEIVREC